MCEECDELFVIIYALDYTGQGEGAQFPPAHLFWFELGWGTKVRDLCPGADEPSSPFPSVKLRMLRMLLASG